MPFDSREVRSRNPYYHLTMVRDPNLFFGRMKIISRLYSAIYDRQCLSLVGPRRIGKSSVLGFLPSADFQKRLGYDFKNYILAFIDTREQTHANHDDFLRFVSEQLVLQSENRLTHDVMLIHSNGITGFREFLDVIKQKGFHPVLLLDEFESITSMPQFDQNFFFFLRAQANAGKVSYITASSNTLDKVAHSDLVGSPFFNIFSTLNLGPLTKDEAVELVNIPSQKAGCPFTPSERDWIFNLAGRHPFFLQRACYYLFEEKQLVDDDTPLDLEQVKQTVYKQLLPHFAYAWKHLDTQQQEQLAWEARRSSVKQQKLPEFSESLLFRQFVCEKSSINLSSITVDDLDKILEKLDDVRFLGESKLGYLNVIYLKAQQDSLSIVEKGELVQKLVLSALEKLRPTTAHRKTEAQWRLHNILSWRFKEKLKNEEIAARLAVSPRHFYREQKKAIGSLLNKLLEMELQSKQELDGEYES